MENGIISFDQWPRSFPEHYVLGQKILHTVMMAGLMPPDHFADRCLKEVSMAVDMQTPGYQIYPNIIEVCNHMRPSCVQLHVKQSLARFSTVTQSPEQV